MRVYPRFAHDHADSAFAGIRTPQLGHVHPLYKRGGNGDFSHLRNYLDGDSINRIDHKASARLGKWLVREYDYEHEQPVILMLDASRRLQTRYKGRALFDEQLAAATRLARAALKSGDEIGLQTFSDTPKIWLVNTAGWLKRCLTTMPTTNRPTTLRPSTTSGVASAAAHSSSS